MNKIIGLVVGGLLGLGICALALTIGVSGGHDPENIDTMYRIVTIFIIIIVVTLATLGFFVGGSMDRRKGINK